MLSIALNDEELVRVAAKLPTAPRILVEVGELLNDPGVDADDMIDLLRRDPALVAQVIRMANSAAFAPSEPIASLDRAVAFVGFAEVHRLVGLVASAQLSELQVRLYPFNAAHLRQNSLFVALLMEELAKFAHERPRTSYTVGLLRNIGMMALERLTPPDAGLTPFLNSGETSIEDWERKNWGLTNPEAAEKILLHWRLPRETVSAIRHHYHPEGKHNPLTHLLKIAATAAADRFEEIPGEAGLWHISVENLRKAGIDERDFEFGCERAQRKFEHLRSMVS